MTQQRKISDLTEVTTLNDDDELVFVKYVVQPFPLEFRWFDLANSQTHTNPTKTGWVLQVKNFYTPTNGQSWDSSKWATVYTSSQLSQTPGGQQLGEITHPSIPALAVNGTHSGLMSRTLDGVEISLVYDNNLGYYKVYIQSALYRMGSGEPPLTSQQYNQHWTDINGEYSITEPAQLFIKDVHWEDTVSALTSLPAIAKGENGNPGPEPTPTPHETLYYDTYPELLGDIVISNHEIDSYNGTYTQVRPTPGVLPGSGDPNVFDGDVPAWIPAGAGDHHKYPVWVQTNSSDFNKYISFCYSWPGETKRWVLSSSIGGATVAGPHDNRINTYVGTNPADSDLGGDTPPNFGGIPWECTSWKKLTDGTASSLTMSNPFVTPTPSPTPSPTPTPISSFCLMPGDTLGNEPGWYRFAGYADGHPGSGPSGDGEYPYWELDGHSGTNNNAYRIFMVESSSYPTTTHWKMRMTTTSFTFPRTEYPWDYNFPQFPQYEATILEGICPTPV